MQCSVKTCNISDDRFLWKCEFCNKSYHAACIGVQRHQEMFILAYMIALCDDCQHNLKTGIDTHKVLYEQKQLIDSIKVQTDANHRIAADLKKLSAMGDLFDNIELQLKESVQCINSSTSTNVANAVSALTREFKNSPLHTNEKNDVVSIKNHLTGLMDISMLSTKQHINDYVDVLTTDLTEELKKICSEVQSLSSLTIEMAAHCNEHNTSQPQLTIDAVADLKSFASTVSNDILNNIKIIADALHSRQSNTIGAPVEENESPPSLLHELAELDIANPNSGRADDSTRGSNVGNTHLPQPVTPPVTAGQTNAECDTSGWRLLGIKRVYKHDWSLYDARQLRHAHQQKQADKARQRKQNAARKNKNAEAKENNRRFTNSSNSINQGHDNDKATKKNNNGDPGKIFVGGLTTEINDEEIKTFFGQFGNIVQVEMPFNKQKNQRKGFCFITFDSEQVVNELLKTPKQTISGKEVDVKKAILKRAKTHLGSSLDSHGGMRDNTCRRTVFGNRTRKNQLRNRHHDVINMLPPDKDLLAAAKVTFSNPSAGKLRGISFQRGEVLNPYPVDHEIPGTSSTSTTNWTCGPALRSSFSQHCSSCSCERSCFR